jgi:small subunit ribosomal protein S6e
MPILIISDPETGKSERVEIEDSRITPLIGLKIGELLEGASAEMPGFKLKLTGGTDRDGIPMRPDVHGSAKMDIILSDGVGYNPKRKGERKRVVVRGNTVSSDTTFLNFSIVDKPKRKKTTKRQKKTKSKKIEKEET